MKTDRNVEPERTFASDEPMSGDVTGKGFRAEQIIDWPENAKSGLIEVEGGNTFYRIFGENKSGIPIIFVHGGPGHNSSTFFRTTALARERPVVYYNQLGSSGSDIAEEYQETDKLKNLFTIERYTEELETIIKHFGFSEYVLAGHSWGTMLAVEYAGIKKPKGLKGLILIGPFLNVDLWLLDAKRLIKSLPDGNNKWNIVKECEATGNYTDEYNKINEIYSSNFFNRIEGINAVTPTEPEKIDIEGFDIYNYMWGPTEFSCTGLLQEHDSTTHLKNIEVPILYVSGEFDSGSPAAASFYKALTSNGKVAVVKGTGHETPREKPEEFVGVVNDFMGEIER